MTWTCRHCKTKNVEVNRDGLCERCAKVAAGKPKSGKLKK